MVSVSKYLRRASTTSDLVLVALERAMGEESEAAVEDREEVAVGVVVRASIAREAREVCPEQGKGKGAEESGSARFSSLSTQAKRGIGIG
jgi:hypothetical protein